MTRKAKFVPIATKTHCDKSLKRGDVQYGFPSSTKAKRREKNHLFKIVERSRVRIATSKDKETKTTRPYKAAGQDI
jgi:hypothetical protein